MRCFDLNSCLLFRPCGFSVNNWAAQEEGGCSHCGKRCDLCKKFLLQASKFQSSATGRFYPIRQNVSCSSKNVIYLATCSKCNLQYVGSTSTVFKVRFRNHKSSMLNNRRICELAAHFNSSEHDISLLKRLNGTLRDSAH